MSTSVLASPAVMNTSGNARRIAPVQTNTVVDARSFRGSTPVQATHYAATKACQNGRRFSARTSGCCVPSPLFSYASPFHTTSPAGPIICPPNNIDFCKGKVVSPSRLRFVQNESVMTNRTCGEQHMVPIHPAPITSNASADLRVPIVVDNDEMRRTPCPDVRRSVSPVITARPTPLAASATGVMLSDTTSSLDRVPKYRVGLSHRFEVTQDSTVSVNMAIQPGKYRFESLQDKSSQEKISSQKETQKRDAKSLKRKLSAKKNRGLFDFVCCPDAGKLSRESSVESSIGHQSESSTRKVIDVQSPYEVRQGRHSLSQTVPDSRRSGLSLSQVAYGPRQSSCNLSPKVHGSNPLGHGVSQSVRVPSEVGHNILQSKYGLNRLSHNVFQPSQRNTRQSVFSSNPPEYDANQSQRPVAQQGYKSNQLLRNLSEQIDRVHPAVRYVSEPGYTASQLPSLLPTLRCQSTQPSQNVLQSTNNPAEHRHNIFQSLQNVPQSANNFIQPGFNLSQPTQTVLQSASNPTEQRYNVSQLSQNVPQSANNLNHPGFSLSQPSQSVLQSAGNLTEQRYNVSQLSQNVPQSANNLTHPGFSLSHPSQNVLQSAGNLTKEQHGVFQSSQNLPPSPGSLTQPRFSLSQPSQNVLQSAGSLTAQRYSVSQSSQNVSQLEHHLTQQQYNLSQLACNLPEPGYSVPQSDSNMSKPRYNLSDVACNLPTAKDNVTPLPSHVPVDNSGPSTQTQPPTQSQPQCSSKSVLDGDHMNEGRSVIQCQSSAQSQRVHPHDSCLAPLSGQRILGTRTVETHVKVPKRRKIQDTVEHVRTVSEIVRREEIVEGSHTVLEHITEVEKPVIKETVVEVPQVKYLETITERKSQPHHNIQIQHTQHEVQAQHGIQEQHTLVERANLEVHERIVEIPKTVQQERIVEQIEIEYRDVVVEKVVEVPDIHEQITIVEKKVPQMVTIEEEEFHDVKVDRIVERLIPVPMEYISEVNFDLPVIEPVYVNVDVDVFVPRFIEVACPVEGMNATELAEIQEYSDLIASLSLQSAMTLEGIDRLAQTLSEVDHKIMEHEKEVVADNFSNFWRLGVNDIGHMESLMPNIEVAAHGTYFMGCYPQQMRKNFSSPVTGRSLSPVTRKWPVMANHLSTTFFATSKSNSGCHFI